ncbi:MAG: PAS domain S-box protein, partial [Gemmatimonadetes bacterium]|nr:PAS domain S-box protein [Gemmatimonadota bacterium]
MIDSSSVAATGGERLALLRGLGLIGQLSEPLFDHLSAAAAAAIGATGARIGLLDGEGDVILGTAGPEAPGGLAAFGRAVAESGEALVGGTSEPSSRAGVPLLSAEEEALGFLCVFADRAREWAPGDLTTLRELARVAVGALELSLEKLLLNSLKESSVDGVLVVTLERRVVTYNRRFVEIWRISDKVLTSGSDEALLDSVLSLVSRPDEFRRRLEELHVRPEEEVCDEITLRDGRVFSRYGAPILAGNGLPRGRMWLFRDITTAGRRYRAARETEERLRAFIESASDAAFTVNEASVITYANAAVERIFGYAPAELVGRPLTTLVPERLRASRPNGPERQSGGVRRIPWGAMELTGLHRDGREIPVEISFGKFASGGRTFYTGIVRDISERKQVERVMHDAAVSYRSLFDSLDELVCITDLDRTILSVNEAVIQRHGFSREEILGATPELLTAHGWTDATGGLERVYSEPGAEPVRLEWWGRTKDGGLFPMEVVLTRGEYFGAPVVIGVGRDISQRLESEQALRRLGTIVESSADAIVSSSVDGLVTSWNAAADRIFGYTSEE